MNKLARRISLTLLGIAILLILSDCGGGHSTSVSVGVGVHPGFGHPYGYGRGWGYPPRLLSGPSYRPAMVGGWFELRYTCQEIGRIHHEKRHREGLKM